MKSKQENIDLIMEIAGYEDPYQKVHIVRCVNGKYENEPSHDPKIINIIKNYEE